MTAIKNRDPESTRDITKNAWLFVPGRVISRVSLYFSGNFILLIAAATLFSANAFAHPLGNFTVNQYSRIEAGKSGVTVRQVLDMAEIPTFQESARIDTDKDGAMSQAELSAYVEQITPGFLKKFELDLNGERLELKVDRSSAEVAAGAGNLQTLRITWDLAAAGKIKDTNQLKFENKNYAERLGWNEIVVNRAPGVSIYNSSAFGSGLSDELRAYPQDSLTAPLAERSAEFSFATGATPDGVQALRTRDGQTAAAVQHDKLAELIALPEITLPIALLGLAIAFGLGAVHAMSPGHGKTVVGAYLVGSRGTVKHAIFLGLTVTITHTIGVFALGLITLFASNYILPEKLMPFLNFVSGLLVFFIGISLFKDRLFGAPGWKNEGRDHSHDHEHEEGEHAHDGMTHTHNGSTHTHLPPGDITWRSLLALGISGGLLPCPSALVLMLSAISLGRIGYGLILTLVFSLGLAATLTAVGMVFLYIGKAFGGSLSGGRLVKAVPVMSALVIACLGAAICYNSLGQ
jgi:nickel/cobalt transporter (NicO) family protein